MEAPAAAPELAEARTSRATEAPVPAPSLEASASPGAPPMVLVNEAPAPAALATSPLACGVAAATPTRRVTSKARARAIVDSARARDDQVGRRAPPPPPPEVVASTPTARGAVSLVLPGRDGTPVVIPGYRLGYYGFSRTRQCVRGLFPSVHVITHVSGLRNRRHERLQSIFT